MLALQEARSLAAASEAPPDLAVRLDALAEELTAATRELRELARGIHPAILEHEGLGAAITGLARRASIPVEVRLDIERRLPPVVESTAYFTVAEALTNTQRYAGASHAMVHVADTGHGLEIEVSDDGIGGADPGRGTGLRGLGDRMHALGGELQVRDGHDHGTTVSARIPIA
jgi:signal transduction histidine kinase